MNAPNMEPKNEPKRATTVGLWRDELDGKWIVSIDKMNSNADCEMCDVTEELDDYGEAKDRAIKLARERGLCVIEASAHSQECIYAPKLIRISDVGTVSIYRLHGNTLAMLEGGGCVDALNRNNCIVNDGMSDSDIWDAVWDAWTDEYDGDPKENGLTIHIDAEKSIIEK
jgi:hypothetical protein